MSINLRLDSEATRALGIETHICELKLILASFALLKVSPSHTHPLRSRPSAAFARSCSALVIAIVEGIQHPSEPDGSQSSSASNAAPGCPASRRAPGLRIICNHLQAPRSSRHNMHTLILNLKPLCLFSCAECFWAQSLRFVEEPEGRVMGSHTGEKASVAHCGHIIELAAGCRFATFFQAVAGARERSAGRK